MAIQGRANAKPLGKVPVGTNSGAPPTGTALKGLPGTVSRESRLKVTTTVMENGTIKGEPVISEEREVKIFATNPANVGMGVQYRRNLQNYEHVQISVDMHMPCYVEEVDSAYAQVLDKIKTKLEEALETLQIAPSEATGEVVEGEAGAEEGTAESTEGAAEEESQIDLEYLKAADLDTLTEIATTNDLGITPGDYAEEDDLRQVLIESILGNEVLQEYLAEQGADGTDQTTEGYSEEELQKGTVDELKQIFVEWELGAFPKGPTPIAKKAAIKKILDKQAAA